MLKRMPWPVIVQIVPELSAGGAERTTIEMAEAITLGGGRALVLSAGGRLEKDLADAGGELIRFPAGTKNPAAIFFNSLRLARIIRQRGVSLVHARSRAPAWSALMAARRTRRCLVTTYHGIYNQEGRLKALYNSVMARGDAVICNSHYTAKIVKERHPKSAARVGVIYRGVDLARFDPSEVSSDRVQVLREKWGIPAGKRIVLLPARLTRWKGQLVLIEAAAELLGRGEFGDVIFVLAGDDQGRSLYRAELEALIKSRSLSSRVIIAGHCEDMPAAFKAASFTVLPSIEAEAFGRSAIELQAMGCLVIASNIGAFPETVSHEPGLLAPVESGPAGADSRLSTGPNWVPWLFEPGNASALTHSLQFALALDHETMEAMRHRSMERARGEFSSRALQTQTLDVYDRLLGTQLAQTFKTEFKR